MEYEQDPPTQIAIKKNTEKQKPLTWTEIQNTENQNATDRSTTKPMLMLEDKIGLVDKENHD